MTKVTILYWQDIPSVVEATDGSASHKQQLSQRFQELIDLIAVKKQLSGSDAYLEHWHKGKPEQRDGVPQAAARAVADNLEANFEQIRAAALAGC